MSVEKYIGGVKLNYDNYPGKDYYSDGSIEDVLLDIVKNHEEQEFNSIIDEKKSWAVMYHLSDIRQNIVEWLQIENTAEILEIGSGCGAITGTLARKAKSVTCIELSEKRSMINAYRNKKYDNIEILLGNFEQVEAKLDKQYDVVTLIGVLEYGGLYIHSDKPYFEFVKTARRHVKPGGRLIIAIENKYGLKYFAGCSEDHVARCFAGIEGYNEGDNVRTFSRKGLERLVLDAGFSRVRFFYPYPDYKLPTTIYSDEWLPKAGELKNNNLNYDNDRMKLFDEDRAFEQIVEEGMFPFFSNSFLVECE